MIGENLSKIIEQMLSMFCMLKEKIYIQLMFQNITQIIKNQLKYQKSEWTTFVIYVDLECLIEKNDGCKMIDVKIKVSQHIPSGFLMSIILSFKSIKNKHNVYRGKNYIKNFCEYLREHAMKVINFKRKKWIY